MSELPPLIKLKNITKIYDLGRVKVAALEDIDLEITEGSYLAIMGPSGSGKSTLMHIIGCLDTPTSGEYHLGSNKVSELPEPALAKIRNQEIGFVFQNFNLLPRLTAMENVELPLIYQGKNKKQRRNLSIEILNKVGLGDRIDHRPNELSGGESQRVALARALVTSPSIILADEPTGNLDTKTGNEIMELFENLWKEERTVIVVTHDPEIAERCKDVVRMRDGKLEK